LQRLANLVSRQKREDVYSVHSVYKLVNANQAELSVRALCETLKVSTSGYYDWRGRPLSKRAQASMVLSEHIRRAHRASDETYGVPRIRAELTDTGVIASRKRIARLMRVMGIQGVSRRRAWCVTTQRNPRQRPAPDLAKRVFVAQDINELWVADMTYIATWEGFLYLAIVTDACSRKAVGWAFGVQMTADLVLSALNMALHTRMPESVIHHSDQGSQYTSIAFGARLPRKWAYALPWARWEMPMTTPWRRAFLPLWSANSLPGAAGEPKPKPAWPSLAGSRAGTTRTGATRP